MKTPTKATVLNAINAHFAADDAAEIVRRAHHEQGSYAGARFADAAVVAILSHFGCERLQAANGQWAIQVTRANRGAAGWEGAPKRALQALAGCGYDVAGILS